MRQGVGNAISLMGARPTSNNFMIDGTSNVDTALGTPAVILSVDAMEEFKEQTKTYSAEYGFSANQINLVSKSGTNEFHGSLFYFGRNEALDAKNFFDPPDRPKPELDQKQFGGTISGPIIKNKTFLLVNYEGARIDRGSSTFYIVPTADQLAGRFTTTIIDPVTKQPFPNNTIPADRFSRLAQLTIRNGWYPAPNSTAPQGNYQQIRTLPQTQNQFTVRLDQDLGRFGRAFARFTKTTYENTSSGSVTPEVGDNLFVQNSKNWQVSHTWPIKSNVVNVFRFGRVEALANQEGIGCSQADLDFLGLTGIFSSIPDPQRGCPGVGMQGYARAGGAVNDYTASNQPMWDVSNTTTWVTGNHTINFGANYRKWSLQRDTAADLTGDFGNFNIRLQRERVRGLPARLLRGRQRLPARALFRHRCGGQPLRVQLDVLRPVHPGRLEGQLQAHPEPGPALRLPQRALRDERPHGVAKPRLCAGRPARGRPEPGSRRLRRRRVLSGSRATQPREPRPLQGLRSPDQLRVPSRPRPGTRSSGAATGSSTTPPSYARSTAPRVSIRMSAADNTSSPSARRRRSRRPTSSSRASRAAVWRRPRPTASSP